jgi:thiol-disulfide isomerase/thioredoxin
MPDTESVTCPRCGFEQPLSAECARCGVIFSKIRSPLPPPVLNSASSETSGGLSPITWLLLFVAVGIGSASFVMSRGEDSVKPESPLPGSPLEVEVPTIPSTSSSNPFPAPLPVAAPREEVRELKPARFPYTWYEGNRGYLEAMHEASVDSKPLAVYFYTDRCPYCRELDQELLVTPQVRDKLQYLVKVRINPERGAAEAEIARRYGVRGYPSFFVQPSAQATATKIAPMFRGSDGWYLHTPEEFSSLCWSAARL